MCFVHYRTISVDLYGSPAHPKNSSRRKSTHSNVGSRPSPQDPVFVSVFPEPHSDPAPVFGHMKFFQTRVAGWMRAPDWDAAASPSCWTFFCAPGGWLMNSSCCPESESGTLQAHLLWITLFARVSTWCTLIDVNMQRFFTLPAVGWGWGKQFCGLHFGCVQIFTLFMGLVRTQVYDRVYPDKGIWRTFCGRATWAEYAKYLRILKTNFQSQHADKNNKVPARGWLHPRWQVLKTHPFLMAARGDEKSVCGWVGVPTN